MKDTNLSNKPITIMKGMLIIIIKIITNINTITNKGTAKTNITGDANKINNIVIK